MDSSFLVGTLIFSYLIDIYSFFIRFEHFCQRIRSYGFHICDRTFVCPCVASVLNNQKMLLKIEVEYHNRTCLLEYLPSYFCEKWHLFLKILSLILACGS